MNCDSGRKTGKYYQHNTDLAQYWYNNQRKKAVQAIIAIIFEKENNHIREAYPSVESHKNILINEENIQNQIKRMPLDRLDKRAFSFSEHIMSVENGEIYFINRE